MNDRRRPGFAAVPPVITVLVLVATSGACGTGRGAASSSGHTGPPTADEMVRAAIVEASCSHDDRPRHALESYSGGGAPRDGKIPCLATAGGGCSAVEKCLGVRVEVGVSSCKSTCDGNSFVYCSDRERAITDCSVTGKVCIPELGCVAGGAPCDPRSFRSRCDGDRPVQCLLGHETKDAACGDQGLICAVDAAGQAACAGDGPPCSPLVAAARTVCDGSSIVSCVLGREHRDTCATFAPGATCRREAASGGNALVTCGVAEACDLSMEPRCEGDAYVACFGGRIARVSCVELGFSGCANDGLGSPRCAR